MSSVTEADIIAKLRELQGAPANRRVIRTVCYDAHGEYGTVRAGARFRSTRVELADVERCGEPGAVVSEPDGIMNDKQD